jgi:hypothetical protein
VRIEAGGYGTEGTYMNVDDRWVYEAGNLAPPSLQAIVFKSSEDPRPLERVLSWNDHVAQEHTADAALESKPFQPFLPVPDENPAVFFGFSSPFPNVTSRIYVHLEEDGAGVALPTQAELAERIAGERAIDVGQSVVWEYWGGKHWYPLLPRDYTDHFNHSGFVEFVGPKDHRRSKLFGDALFWVRARLEMGGYDVPPRIDRVLLNAVSASNITTYHNHALGSSQGTPNQFFSFNKNPVLSGQELRVREKDPLTDHEVELLRLEMGADAVLEDPDYPGEMLVRWREVTSLYESGPRSRHYTKDVVTGEIRFGDGVRGMVPPKGERNIIAVRYQVGGGEEGNVAAGAITVAQQSMAFLEAVSNPFAAVGGCDLETVEEVKMRGPHMLKSRNRAVTAEDFEWLAIEASNSVARVRALPSVAREGEVTVIVVPKLPRGADGQIDLTERPVPSTELLRKVRRYLDERRLLTTIVRVSKPRYVEMTVEVRMIRGVSGSSDRVKREIAGRLRRFLHPLVGGRDGKGWPFGRSVFKADLYHVVEEVQGVDFVDSLRIISAEQRREVDQLRLESDQLVSLVDVDVSEISHERIL